MDGGQRRTEPGTKLPGAILNSACAGPEGASPMDGTSKPSPGRASKSSRPQSGTREVSAVRSTDFLAGPRGLTRGARLYEPVTWVTDLTGHMGDTFYFSRPGLYDDSVCRTGPVSVHQNQLHPDLLRPASSIPILPSALLIKIPVCC